mmetsp:Transcript_13696/g.23166  ORF Transcript_13696/g.23166 Transcript_13696/m.23166 type:complete len:251 (+) Transcript_13696:142-894(+)
MISLNWRQMHLEEAEGDGLVDGHGGTDAHPDGVDGADEEHDHGDRATEGVLEFVDGLNEGHGDEAHGHGSHRQHAEQLVGDHAQLVEGGEEIPLGEDLEGGGEGVGGLADRGGVQNGQTDHARDGAEDHHGEDVEEIVGPRGLAVVVVAHALGELGAQDGVREVGLLDHGGAHLQGAAGDGGAHAKGVEAQGLAGHGRGGGQGADGGGACLVGSAHAHGHHGIDSSHCVYIFFGKRVALEIVDSSGDSTL